MNSTTPTCSLFCVCARLKESVDHRLPLCSVFCTGGWLPSGITNVCPGYGVHLNIYICFSHCISEGNVLHKKAKQMTSICHDNLQMKTNDARFFFPFYLDTSMPQAARYSPLIFFGSFLHWQLYFSVQSFFKDYYCIYKAEEAGPQISYTVKNKRYTESC